MYIFEVTNPKPHLYLIPSRKLQREKIPIGVWETHALLIPRSVRGGMEAPICNAEWHVISTDPNSVYLSAENVMTVHQKCPNHAGLEWNIGSYMYIQLDFQCHFRNFSASGQHRPNLIQPATSTPPQTSFRVIHFQQGSLWISFCFLSYQSCRRSWLGVRSRREKHRKQRAWKILVLENQPTNRGITTAWDSGLSEDCTKWPSGLICSFPSLNCSFLKWFQFPRSLRGSSRKEGARKAEAQCFSQWLPWLCSDNWADEKMAPN